MSIKSQLENIKSSLPSHVELVAVSKTHPAESIAEAYALGQRIFGESRVQELVAKSEILPKDIEWHQIGHLQTNKVKYIAPFVTMIHSLDSIKLAETIEAQAAKNNRTIDVLLEIHVAQEETKSGWRYDELCQFIESGALSAMTHLRVRGVMGIATNSDDNNLVRKEFETLRSHFEELKSLFDTNFDTLSMGMSDDYPLAIECGSTMVRVGSMIFGSRYYA